MIDVSGNKPRVVEASVAVGAGLVATPEPVSSGTGGIMITTALGGAAVYGIAQETVLNDGSDVTTETFSSSVNIGAETEDAWETPDDLEIALLSGAIYEQDGYDRGYGWEYIDKTTSITKTEIGNVIGNAGESKIIERMVK
ncbi:hypothetical protein CP556_08230 [Natrinema sp. CBA1119]|uniref:hypothetical protein n=1 Tax=Natrinema sp. CBA1119 TaxID=1608465 RepID=UPI000BF51DFD|nr:hypothetical protein [Natrinema sp. CBA1119]PGF16105.1 hypothetical protein CP556_08230 [Natrinema sp. CBA1119]